VKLVSDVCPMHLAQKWCILVLWLLQNISRKHKQEVEPIGQCGCVATRGRQNVLGAEKLTA